MLLKVFQLLVDSLFFHFEAFVVLEFHEGSLSFDLVYELLILAIDLLDILDSSKLHGAKKVIAIVDELLSLFA